MSDGAADPQPDDGKRSLLRQELDQRPRRLERRRRPGELDRVGVDRGRFLKDRVQIVRRPAERRDVDQPLRLAEPRHLGGRLEIELDIFRARDNRLPQEQHPLVVGPLELAAVLRRRQAIKIGFGIPCTMSPTSGSLRK